MYNSTTIQLIPMRLLGFFVVLLFLAGCNTEEDYPSLSSSAEISALIPNDVWLNDALASLEKAKNTEAKYILKNALPSFQNELRIFFDQNQQVYKTEVLAAGEMICALFFEGRRMVYSLHHSESTAESLLVAYANEKPYAAAIAQNSDWQPKNPNEIEGELPLISASKTAVHRMEQKEQHANYLKRLVRPEDQTNSHIKPFEQHHYVINASKGELLQIELESKSDNVLFTMGPIDGINMEVRSWEGVINTTGDIGITVFTMEPDSAESYSLGTHIATSQIQS